MPTSALPLIRGRALFVSREQGLRKTLCSGAQCAPRFLCCTAGYSRAVGAGVLDCPQIETYASFLLIRTISPSAIR